MLDSIPSFARLVTELAKFPGVGRKTATRLAFYVLRQPEQQSEALASAIREVKMRVRLCSRCFHLTEVDPCAICSDSSRDGHLLCIVEQPQDLLAIERGRSFHGRYHILHGALSPLDGIGPEQLRIRELLERVEAEGVTEVVVATNFSVEGEATALYLAQRLRPLGIRVTRLAYGIPLGSDLEYVDDATVSRAIEGRREL
jgi:recombination protein RecR